MIKLSTKLKAEIKYLCDAFNDSGYDGETLSELEALRRLIEDSDGSDSVAAAFKNELKNIQIQLGIVRPISQKEMDNTYVTRGKKYDFKLKGIYYVFDSWDGLEKFSLTSNN